ncbi:hypothetical protein JNW90_29910 [Micromonospora sp. STR1s_5]|nr:hypothetical protein [Micromonospora sp. STR1s_5]
MKVELQRTERARKLRLEFLTTGPTPFKARIFGLWFLAVAVLTGGAVPAQAVECPIAHPVTATTAIRETPEQIRELSSLLKAQGTGAAADIISFVRRAHPSASDAEVTNYLVTAYCPVLEQDRSLSEAEKRARLESFSSRLMHQLAR